MNLEVVSVCIVFKAVELGRDAMWADLGPVIIVEAKEHHGSKHLEARSKEVPAGTTSREVGGRTKTKSS